MKTGQIRVFSGRSSKTTFLKGCDVEVMYVMLGPTEEDPNEWKAVILCATGRLAYCVQQSGTICEADVDWWESETEELLCEDVDLQEAERRA